MPACPPPEVAVTGDLGPQTPLVVLLHGRGSHEKEIIGLADHLPAGAAFAGGLLPDHPQAYAGTAILYGTPPFEAGVPTTPGHLAGAAVFLAHGSHDLVIAPHLQARTWSSLHDESGAVLTARRDPVGPGPAPLAVDALRDGLAARLR